LAHLAHSKCNLLRLGELNEGEPLNDSTVFEMLLDDLGNVAGLDLCVPDAVGIYKHCRPDRAKTDRAAVGKHDLAHWVSAFLFLALPETFGFKDMFKFFLDGFTSRLSARLAVAHKYVPLYRRLGDWSQLDETFAVFYDLFLSHTKYCATTVGRFTSKTLGV